MPFRVRVPTVVTVHDLTFFDHPEWHERSKVVFFRRMIRAARARAPRRSSACASTPPTGCSALRRTARRGARRPPRRRPRPVPARRRRRADLARCSRRTASRRRTSRSSGTIEPRKDVPTLVAAFAPRRARPSRPAPRARRRRRMGRRARCATRSPRAASRPHVLRPGYRRRRRRSPRSSGGPRWSRIRRSRRASGCPRSKRSRAARRSSRRAGSALAEVVGDAALAIVARRRRRARGGAAHASSTTTRVAAELRARRAGARRARSRGSASVDGAPRRLPRGPRRTVAHEGAHHRRERLRRAAPVRAPARVRRRGRVVRPIGRPEPLDITDRDAVARRARARPPRRRVPPRRASRTSANRGDEPDRVPARQRRRHRRTCSTPRARADVRRVLVVGSAEEYGLVDDADLPLARGRRRCGRSTPYGASKVAASYLALQACLGGGLETIRVRAVQPHRARASRRTFLVPALARPHRARPNATARDEIARRLARPGARPQRRPRRRARVPPARRATARRARSTTSARGAGVSVARDRRPAARRARRGQLRLVQDPDARAPGRGPAPRRRSGQAARRHRLVARVHARPDAHRRARRRTHARRGPRDDRRPRVRSGVLAVEPAEERGDRAGVVAQAVGSVGDDPQLDALAAARRRAARRVLDRHDVVGAAVHEQPRAAARCARRRRSESRLAIARIHARRIGRVVGVAQHAGAARVLEEPLGIVAPTCATTPARRTSRCRARARRRAAVTIASVPPSRKPAIHTPVTSVRACNASTAARTSASQPSIEKSPSDGAGAAERERQPGPARLARDAIAQRRVGVPDGRGAARAARETRAARATRERASTPAGARSARRAAALPKVISSTVRPATVIGLS